jgi:hypothetical protein
MPSSPRSVPKVTLVVGMHRSGTSLTASFLAGLGLVLSDDLLEANEANSRGYFESRTIVQFHDRVLAELGGSWRTPTTTKPFPAGWGRSEQIAPYALELEEIAREEIARAGGHWIVKDPRASRLLPLWNAALERIGAEASYIVTIRDPAEVAASLLLRDEMDRALSDLLWLEHTVDALVDGGSRIKAIVPYAAWFDDAKGAATRLARALGLSPSPARLRTALADAVADELRHHTLSDRSQLPFVDSLYALLLTDRRDDIDAELLRIASARRLSGIASRIADEEGRSEHATSIHQISHQLSWRQDVSEDAVSGLLDADDIETRRTARLARSRTSIRHALADAIRAAEVDAYLDPLTMRPVKRLAEIADIDAPFLHVLRHQALQCVSAGDVASGIRLLAELFRRSYATGMRSGPAAVEALANLNRAEVLAACEAIAQAIVPRTTRTGTPREMIAIVYTTGDPALLDRVRERGRQLVARGFGVVPVPSQIEDGSGDAPERLRGLLHQLMLAPVPMALFMAHAQDVVARIASLCIPPEIMLWEDPLGPVSASDLFVALPELLDTAAATDRHALGVPESAVLVATVGRLEKYAHPPYLGALSRILASNENAWLAICGSDAHKAQSLIFTSFHRSVRKRLIFADPEHWRSLVKASDVYCDGPPWNGTRGPLAAAYLGVPIAAFVDPSVRARPAVKAILGRSLPIATTAGRFRDILEKYIRDPALRAEHGGILKARAHARFDAESAAKRLITAFESGAKLVSLQPPKENRTVERPAGLSLR